MQFVESASFSGPISAGSFSRAISLGLYSCKKPNEVICAQEIILAAERDQASVPFFIEEF